MQNNVTSWSLICESCLWDWSLLCVVVYHTGLDTQEHWRANQQDLPQTHLSEKSDFPDKWTPNSTEGWSIPIIPKKKKINALSLPPPIWWQVPAWFWVNVHFLLPLQKPQRYTGRQQPGIYVQKRRHYLPEAVTGHFHSHRIVVGDRHFCRGWGDGSRHSGSGIHFRCSKPVDRPMKEKYRQL